MNELSTGPAENMAPRSAASRNVPIVFLENAMPVWRDIAGATNQFVPPQNLFLPGERLKTGGTKECFTADR
jgi:hypothetical protein